MNAARLYVGKPSYGIKALPNVSMVTPEYRKTEKDTNEGLDVNSVLKEG